MSSTKKAKRKPMRRRAKIIWQMAVLVLVLVVLAAISLVAFFTSETTFRSTFAGVGKSSEVSSMLDAKLICDKKVKDKYDKSLQHSTLNDYSSRYEADFGGYKLFYDVNVYRSKRRNDGTDRFMFKCYVLSDGNISQASVVKRVSRAPEASRKTKTNLFGY